MVVHALRGKIYQKEALNPMKLGLFHSSIMLLALLSSVLPATAEQTLTPLSTSQCEFAFTAYKQGRYESAIVHADAALVSFPRFARAFYIKGLALMSLKRYNQAALAFQSAVRIDPRNESYRTNLDNALSTQSELATRFSTLKSTSLFDSSEHQPTFSIKSTLPQASSNPPEPSQRAKFEAEAVAFEDYGVEGLEALLLQSTDNADVSPEFIALVKAGLRNLPREFRERFRNAGFRINIVTNVSKVMSESQIKRHPRGYGEGATFENVLAYCDYRNKQLVVIQPPDGIRSLPDVSVCHEFGHAFDAIMSPKLSRSEAAAQGTGKWPLLSHAQRFKSAYDQDLLELPEAHREALAYFLQSNQAGQEELFAEMFPLLYCKQPIPGSRLELLRTSFPNVLSEMRNALGTYE